VPAVHAAPVSARRLLVLDGEPGAWLPAGLDVIGQRGEGLGERLAAAFDDAGGPTFLVGMDTPQVTPELLACGLRALSHSDSVLGMAQDGGYWGIGLRVPDAAAFAGVPMSVDETGALQLARLRGIGLAPALLPVLRDVDFVDDARAVAELAPASRFAAALAAIQSRIAARQGVAA